MKSSSARWLFAALALAAAAGFLALGIWQVERRVWKLDLIARVDARVHAGPTALPKPADWPHVTDTANAYTHVRTTGTWRHNRETFVQAVTDLGPGFWVITPLQTPSGTILINRGFVPPERRDPATRSAAQITGPVTVTGLLRITEPKGAFLRSNDPATDHWYSRDVAAIASARHLTNAAPFFVDADAAPNPGGYPVGGLTVIAFRNSHLVYAITWFTLAAMSLGAVFALFRGRPKN